MNTGEIIRRLRENRGWTQAELARRAGTTRVSVNKWEDGTRGLTLHSAVQVADALGVSLDVLAGRTRMK